MVEIIVKASVILGVAALADVSLRRRGSASSRHLLWTFAIAALLALPTLTTALPPWTVVVRTAAPAVATPAVVDRADHPVAAPTGVVPVEVNRPAAAAVGSGVDWPAIVLTVYLAGLLSMVARLALQRHGVRRMLRQTGDALEPEWTHLQNECAAVIGLSRPVRLLRSRERSMPMAVGIWRPAIMVPAIADTWSEDRRRAVLLHELAHVARFDCLTQTLALLACSVYWFHPGAWWAAHRLRVERELACDDLVLAAGSPAREYAGHLLEIAYTFGGQRAPALAVSMARPRHLEGRMLAVLDASRNRRIPARRARLAGTMLAAALIVPVAAVTTTVGASADRPESAVEQSLSRAEAGDVQPARVHTLSPVLKSTTAELWGSARRRLRDVAAAFGLRAPQAKGTGTWEVRPSKTNDGTVHLRLAEGDSSWGRTVRLDALEGLTATQLSGGGPVQFTLRRDAGTFTFKGVVQGGVGAGTFSFAPDPAFADGLAKRGFARPTASEQYALARADVGYAFLDELTKQGYSKPTTAELVRAGEHGVHTEYLREMGALGYRSAHWRR